MTARDAARDWEAIRRLEDIQYAPLPPLKAPEPPAWLNALNAFLRELLGPLGEMLGLSWPVLSKVLIALTILLVLFALWRLVSPLIGRRGDDMPTRKPEWTPDRCAALSLLEEADRLAAQGCYAQAIHLLLQRSVAHIADAHPDWLLPATTAREIAALPMLPDRARKAFGAIAIRVEHSLFALKALDRADWEAARSAYAEFALAELAS